TFKSKVNGSPGQAAAASGADLYLLVQATQFDDGAQIAIVTPYSTSDQPLGPSIRVRLSDWRVPLDFDAASLFGEVGLPRPIIGEPAGLSTVSDSRSVLVAGGTQVVVSMLNTVSSSTASVDDTFAFRVASDVVVHGCVVIKKGAPGQGTITSANGATGNGQAGKLGMRFDYVMSADGLKIPLTSGDRVASGEDKKGASSTATILGYAFLGFGGLFMHNFVRGGQMQVDPSAKITVYVDHNVHVAGEPLDEQTGYAQ
ncbi:MAG: hypothetical protein IAI50_11190, partial [Candidatus Eremiobacteraeota bacterium]|nr:hypothetical protein [Candidatus Eremiobacteraeota bacterium]